MLLRPPRFEALLSFLAILFASSAFADVPVTIVGFEFMPRDIVIEAGETVTWSNPEGQFHTVTNGGGSVDPEAGFVFDAYLLGDPKQMFSQAFPDSGVFSYFCRFHESLNMMGTVMVTAPAGTGVGSSGASPELSISPNPSRGDAALRFRLTRSAEVGVAVYDLTGRRVRQLYRGSLTQGDHALRWDGRDDNGVSLSSGVYVLRLESLHEARSARVTLLR